MARPQQFALIRSRGRQGLQGRAKRARSGQARRTADQGQRDLLRSQRARAAALAQHRRRLRQQPHERHLGLGRHDVESGELVPELRGDASHRRLCDSFSSVIPATTASLLRGGDGDGVARAVSPSPPGPEHGGHQRLSSHSRPADRRAFRLLPGIESIIQAVTHQVESDDERNDRKPGPECHPWRLAEKLPGNVKHGAP